MKVAAIAFAMSVAACGAQSPVQTAAEPASAPTGQPKPEAAKGPVPAAQAAQAAAPAQGEAAVQAGTPADEAAVPVPARDGVRLASSDDKLPTCLAVDEGLIYYVIDRGEFEACAKGSWVVVDLRGKDGAPGARGQDGLAGAGGLNGATGATGAAGINGADGKTGATGGIGANGVQGEQGEAGPQGAPGAQGERGAAGRDGVDGQSIVGATGATGSRGAAGATGATGATGTGVAGATGATGVGIAGATGATGAVGATGAAGRNAAGYYRSSDDSYVGAAIDSSGSILFSDNTMTIVNIDGTPANPYGRHAAYRLLTACGFTNTGCTGTCYVTAPGAQNTNSEIDGLVKNTLYYTGSGWLKASGSEADHGAVTLQSEIGYNGQCTLQSWVAPRSYIPAAVWTPPAGISFPLGNLYLGSGQ